MNWNKVFEILGHLPYNAIGMMFNDASKTPPVINFADWYHVHFLMYISEYRWKNAFTESCLKIYFN